MTGKIDTIVQSAPPAAATVEKNIASALDAKALEKRTALIEKREAEMQSRRDRWKAISEGGGIEAWVTKELARKGVAAQGDPSRMSDGDKNRWKTQKKAEIEERKSLKKLAWEAWKASHITHLGAGIFWKDKEGADKFDIPKLAEKARDNDLPALANSEELAKALGLSIDTVRWLGYHREVETISHYRSFTIPKRDGTPRTIRAPKKTLKTAQRWVLRNLAEKLPVHGNAHGFLANRSIVTNARVHAGADVLVKLDIKDFFPTVTWRRVKGLFRKAGVNESVATILALLSTEAPREAVQFRGKTLNVATGPRALPQGAPTSPAITNAICMRMDRRLSALARSLGFRYTRYADDMAFSWRRPIENNKRTRCPVGLLLRAAQTVVRAEGFTLHPDKTRVMRDGDRQKITGLVVNKSPDGTPAVRVPREVIRKLRAAIHNRSKGKPGLEGESLAQLRGMAAFIHMTDARRGAKFMEQIEALEARASK